MDLGGSYISAALCQAKFFRHGGLVMQIRPDSISSKREFNAKGEISPQCVEAYFDAFDGCRALSPLTYDAHLLHHGKFITLRASIQVSLELCCHRCGRSFVRDFSTDVDLKLFEASSVGGVEEIVLSEEELDTVTYQGDVIDLDNILLESIYLEFDGDCMCSPDCKGICTQCGQNLNLGTCSCPKNLEFV